MTTGTTITRKGAHHYAWVFEQKALRTEMVLLGGNHYVLEVRSIGRPVSPARTLRSTEECDAMALELAL